MTAGKGGFELVFESRDLDGILSRLHASQTKLVHGIREQPWGQRVLRFYDPDGNVIEVGEPMGAVVRRLLQQGMSVDDISSRTAMPPEEVKRLGAEK